MHSEIIKQAFPLLCCLFLKDVSSGLFVGKRVCVLLYLIPPVTDQTITTPICSLVALTLSTTYIEITVAS